MNTNDSGNGGSAEGTLNYCVAVDWEPTALHLRYQASLEKVTTTFCDLVNSD